jgi:ligand-binding sensor domain-containing protein
MMRLAFLFIVVVALACGCSDLGDTAPLAALSPALPTEARPAFSVATLLPDSLLHVNQVSSHVTWSDLPLCADLVEKDEGDHVWHYAWRTSFTPSVVRSLAVDGDWLWAVTPQALWRIHRPTMTCERLGESHGVPARYLAGIRGLVVDSEGWLWVYGPGLLRHRAEKWEVVTDEPVWGFGIDAEGDLWNIRPGRYTYHGTRLGHSAQNPGKRLPPFECGRWRVRKLGLGYSTNYNSLAECWTIQERLSDLEDIDLIMPGVPMADYQPAVVTAQGNLWLVNRRFYDQGSLVHVAFPQGDQTRGELFKMVDWPYGKIAAIAADDASDGVWFSSQGGLAFSDGDGVRFYTLFDKKWVPTGFQVTSLAVSDDGFLWAGAREGVLYLDESRAFRGHVSLLGPSRVANDGRGGMWLWSGSQGRGILAHYGAGVWRTWWAPRSWSCPVTTLQAVDDQVWLGAPGCGLARFDGQDWHLPREKSLASKPVLSPQGEVYTINSAGQLQVYNEGTWLLVAGVEPLELGHVLVVDERGGIWVAGLEGVYYLYKGVRQETYYNISWIESSLLDSRGWLWVGTCQGVLRLDTSLEGDGGAREWERVGPYNSYNNVCTRVLIEDWQGRIWAGGDYGLKMTDSSAWDES